MVSKRETAFGVFYYLLGLGVTLASPVLGLWDRVVLFSGFALVVFLVEAGRRLLESRKAEQLTREPQVEVLLDSLIDTHIERAADCHLRANVMVPYENRPVLSQFLNRFSDRTLEFKDHTGGYSQEELALSYKPRQGACGLAWDYSRPVVYGEGQREIAEDAMSEEQIENTIDVESVLSVPVYDGERRQENLVCVVNLDSEAALPETCFKQEDVKSRVEDSADLIAATVEESYHV